MPFISHQTYLTLIRGNESEVLEYDSTNDKLVAWLWPAKAGDVAVPPGELRRHRMTHEITNPCCLCPRLQKSSRLIETAVLVLHEGPWSGECVALCARGQCGYVAFLDRIYKNPNLQLQYSSRRDYKKFRPRPVYHHSEDAENIYRVEPGKYADQSRETVKSKPVDEPSILQEHAGTHAWSDSIEVKTRFARVQPGCGLLPRPVGYRELLEKLDARLDPGVPEATFNQLFVKCKYCGNVMTRFVFTCHVCAYGGRGSDSE